jgi:ComF family protein
MARAPLVYDQTILNVVHCYKYKGKIQLAGPLGGLLLATFNCFWDKDSIDVIVPVPLHFKRLRKRGFNQVFLLIRNWKKFAAASHIDLSGVRIERNAIVRAASTSPQTGLGRKARMTNIKNAFKIQYKEKIKDKTILLVDDVYTTGATVNECARLLLKGGANHVDVLTLARAI